MKNYKRVVVAFELQDENDYRLIEHAKCMVQDFKADVILVHAVAHEGTYIATAELEVKNAMFNAAVTRMKELGKHIGIAEKHQIVEDGSAKIVILEAAEKHKADLIIVGSHGRQGLQLLLGSTANAVLHGAKCDVLAVRLKE